MKRSYASLSLVLLMSFATSCTFSGEINCNPPTVQNTDNFIHERNIQPVLIMQDACYTFILYEKGSGIGYCDLSENPSDKNKVDFACLEDGGRRGGGPWIAKTINHGNEQVAIIINDEKTALEISQVEIHLKNGLIITQDTFGMRVFLVDFPTEQTEWQEIFFYSKVGKVVSKLEP